MKKRHINSGFLLFSFLLLLIFLPVQAQAIDTTYTNGITVTWDANPLSVSEYYVIPNFKYYESASFHSQGDTLHVTFTLPAEYVKHSAPGYFGSSISLYVQNNNQWSTVQTVYAPSWYTDGSGNTIVPNDPLVLDATFFVNVMTNSLDNRAFEIRAHTWTNVPYPEVAEEIYLELDVYTALELQISIEFNPDKLGDPDDNPNITFDRGHNGSCPVKKQGLPNYSVNTSTLNLVVQDADYLSDGPGPRIDTTRTWNTVPSSRGMFGNGWSFPYESTIKADCSGASLKKGSGQVLRYSGPISQSLCYGTGPFFTTPPTGVLDKLTFMPGNYWIWEEKRTKFQYRYDLVGTDAQGVSTYRLTSITDRNGNAATFAYNANGTVATITDAVGRTAAFTYDANNSCTTMTTPDGKTATYSYDARGNLIQTVDLLGTVISYTYDASNYMTSLKVDNKTTAFSYDKSGGWYHVASITDANGNTKTYSSTSTPTAYSTDTAMTDSRGNTTYYNSYYGRTNTIHDPLAHYTGWTYTAKGLPDSVQDSNYKITNMEYDASGNLTKQTDPLGNAAAYTYDANDNMLTRTNPLNQTWTYAYDGNGNLVQMTSPLGKQTTHAYDAKGRLTGTTDENGNTTSYTYNAFGNVKTVTDPLGNITTYGYDAYGINRTSRTDANGNTSQYSYDNNRRLTKETYADGTYKTYSYDSCAMVASTDENGNMTILTRDQVLNITGITDPLGKVAAKGYDGNNNLISQTDALNHAYINTYDPANRATGTTDPAGKTVGKDYDGNSNLTTLQDERTKTTAFSYDYNNLLLTTTDPLANSVTNARDALGRISQISNARGGAVGFAYDADGRMIQKSYGGAVAAAFGYDNVGNRTSVSDASGATIFSFNSLNRVTGIQYPDATALSFTYDKAGNVGTITYPGGLAVSYSYDSRNRVQTVSWDTNSMSCGYDGAGNRLSEVRSNGTTSNYIYDGNNRVTRIDHKQGSNSFAQMNYTRDVVGNTVSEADILPVYHSVTGATGAASYNDANQIAAWGTDAYLYDQDGNLTAIAGSKILSATYDQQNRPTTLTVNGVAATYSYDGSGNRIRSLVGGQTRNYHYDQNGRLMFETDGSGNVLAYYIYAGERLLALKESGASYFYHFDKTGNTVALTSNAGAVVNAYAYTPFGEIAGTSGTLYNPFTYVGEFGVMSEGSNVYFMKNRYYDAATGRFIQKDPVGLAGGQTNLYAYVGGNPVERIDPAGLGDNIMGGTFDINNNQPPVNMCDMTASKFEMDFELYLLRSVTQFVPVLGSIMNVGQLAKSIYDAIYNKGSKQEVVKNIIFLAPFNIGNALNVLDDYLETTTGHGFRIDVKPIPATSPSGGNPGYASR